MSKKEWKQGADAIFHKAGSFGNGSPMYDCYTLTLRLTEGQIQCLQRELNMVDGYITYDIVSFISNAIIRAQK